MATIKNLLLLLCILFSLCGWTEKGFNFRSTSGYVSDGAGETYVLGETSSTTRDGATWIWSACADCKRDRDSGIDRRLAGFNGKTNDGTQSSWTLTLSQTGTYTVCIAMGDASFDQIYQRADIYDDSTLKFSIVDTNGTTGGSFTDTTGTTYSAATFFANWTCQTGVEFASTTFKIMLGATSAQANQSTLSHVYIELEADAVNAFPTLEALGEI